MKGVKMNGTLFAGALLMVALSGCSDAAKTKAEAARARAEAEKAKADVELAKPKEEAGKVVVDGQNPRAEKTPVQKDKKKDPSTEQPALSPAQGQEKAGEQKPKGRWEVQKSGIEDDLTAVTFVSDKLGWAVGAANTIIATTDGGKTWRRQVPRKKDGPAFAAVLFTSDAVGWVRTGITGTVLHTTDGGANWKEIAAFRSQGGSFCYHAAVGRTYFYHHSSNVFRTDDGGATVADLAKYTSPLGSQRGGGMCFTDLKHGCIAFEPNGGYALTTDGGKTWKVSKVKEEDAWGVCSHVTPHFVDSKTGWLMPTRGFFLNTTDSGATWQRQDIGRKNRPMLGIQFLNAKVGHVLTYQIFSGRSPEDPGSDVRRTIDGGKTWEDVGERRDGTFLRQPGAVAAMSFPSLQHGWVVGRNGYIEHYHESEENK